MYRLAPLFSALLLLTAVLAVTARPNATAQDQDMAIHPVVGGWKLDNEPFVGDEGFPSVALFHDDGTYSEVLPWGAVLHGVWEPTGERTANLTFLLNDIIEDKLVQGEGRAMLEVDETGNTMSMIGNFISVYEDGALDMAVESPSTATRLVALPMVPLGTPVIPPDVAASAATPTS